ncbi:MAG: glycosyltransferase family 4 protein, partial [Pseudomonadota bacterium]
ERIRRFLADSGVLHRVKMYNHVGDILDLLAASDLCLLPAESLYAKMDLPLVLLEALALGVPLVISDIPPLSELLVDEVGIGIPPKDPQALAAGLKRLLKNPTRIKKLGETARVTAKKRFDIQEVSRQYENLYEELLANIQ